MAPFSLSRSRFVQVARSLSSSRRAHMVKYISSEDLATLIKTEGKNSGVDYLVVDVRDDDFVGGNITNARNIPSREFSVGVYDLAQKSKEIGTMVFHCALSQVRGPKAARVRSFRILANLRQSQQIYEEIRQNLNIPAQHGEQEVLILRNGFTEFQLKYKARHHIADRTTPHSHNQDDPVLVEKWDPEIWQNAEDWS
ncbi:Rhodanese domain-containing protein [Mycena indigotica]|uniref:Rhodanese domain-containing protein n=1 Tax=Mycena indigotica TaxID=2126181 RepID=A0A8H6SH32_9AGAR|nr:Rhodanese domain-containing protein [Mycena indigotica]KAF7298838.1 Rhodanese domain-containing protein [Mycena indigotica]